MWATELYTPDERAAIDAHLAVLSAEADALVAFFRAKVADPSTYTGYRVDSRQDRIAYEERYAALIGRCQDAVFGDSVIRQLKDGLQAVLPR